MGVIRPSAFERTAGAPVGVAVLGATGSVGQRFVQLLADHPWFQVRALCASERRVGEKYGDSVAWVQSEPIPSHLAALPLSSMEALSLQETPLVFCALPSEAAAIYEKELASRGFWIVSNAGAHRMHPAVPLMVPEINGPHLGLVEEQNGPGAIVAGPNCSAAGLVLALAPLQRVLGLHSVSVVTMQAHSGAGLPGVLGEIALDNVMPWIPGEEAKLESEPLKIIGADFVISATCNRVSVVNGHTESVSVRFQRDVSAEEILAAWRDFAALDLPSAPKRPVVYLEEDNAPNPKSHVDLHGGMATIVGRLRPCPVMGWKFTLLSHNTLRGAAGGAILIAEQLVAGTNHS